MLCVRGNTHACTNSALEPSVPYFFSNAGSITQLIEEVVESPSYQPGVPSLLSQNASYDIRNGA